MTAASVCFTISATHPSLPGHFPGRPVVPGVVLLDEVLARLQPGAILLTAKFTAPVLPDQLVAMTRQPTPHGVAFHCTAEGRSVLHGTVALPPEPS